MNTIRNINKGEQKMKKTIITMVTAALLSSCGLYRSYERPSDIQTDSLYRSDRTLPGDSAGIGTLNWREVFTDPQLQKLIEKGLAQNTDMLSAQLTIEQAEASLKAAKWAYIPSLTFTPSGTFAAYDWDKATKTYEIPVTASWQLDLFGSLHNAKKGAQAQLANSQAYKQAVQSSLVAAIANYYYSLAMLKDQLQISIETEQSWRENVRITRALMEAGQSNLAAVSQTEANYYSICTNITDLKQEISGLEDEFSSLLGETPQKYPIGTLEQFNTPKTISAGVPLIALANRPDVKQAETNLAVAYYATNEARSAFYPAITIAASLGWTNDLGTVIKNPGEWLWSAIGSLTQPLFQNGQLRAQYKISKAQQEQAKLSFQQTLLDAGVEVNAALTKIDATTEKETLYAKQVEALEKAVESTQQLMINSSTNYLEVLTAQQSLLSAQLTQVSNKFEEVQAVIELYQALGGGYEE